MQFLNWFAFQMGNNMPFVIILSNLHWKSRGKKLFPLVISYNLYCFSVTWFIQGADKSLARPGRKQATATGGFSFSYILLFNHNWRNISTVYIYIYIYITRLASNEIFSPSNKIHWELGRAKDLSAPLIHIINSADSPVSQVSTLVHSYSMAVSPLSLSVTHPHYCTLHNTWCNKMSCTCTE
jgi:hypothetical protein